MGNRLTIKFSFNQGVSQHRWLTYSLLLLIALLSLLPSLRLLNEAMAHLERGFDAPIMQILQSSSTWLALQNSLYTATLGTFIAVILGSFFAFILSLTDIRMRPLLVFCFMLPMMIPPQVSALSWLQLFGPASPILNTFGLAPPLGSAQPMYSAQGISLLLGIQHAPLVFLALRTSLLNLPRDLIEAAQLCGSNQRHLWLHIIIPLSWPAIIAGASIAFVSALGNFGIPAMLGIPAGYIVLPTLIYQQMAGFGNDVLSEVASLSMIIALLVFVGMLAQQWFEQRSRYSLLGLTSQNVKFKLGRWRIFCELLLMFILTFILIAPLIALIFSSFVPALGVGLSFDTFTTGAYTEIIAHQGATYRAFNNSLMLASAAALILVIIALPLAYVLAQLPLRVRILITTIIEVPFAIPGIVLSVAFILLFASPIPLLNIQLYGTLGIILLAYLSCFLAVALKPVCASLSQLEPGLIEAARIVGANPFQLLTQILLPLVAPALFAAALLVFLLSVNELTVSALLWSAGNETLGVLVFNLDESGDSVLAAALSVLIVLLVAGLMMLLSLLAPRLPKGVIPWHI